MKKLVEGSSVRITCPECEQLLPPRLVRLIVRTNRQNDSQFLGCPNYPACRHTQKLPQEIVLRLAGQKELF